MAREWVLDASVALAWAIADERSAAAERFFSEIEPHTHLWVPPLWWYELANALESARRRGRLSAGDVAQVIALIGRLTILTDFLLGEEAIWRHRSLAAEHALSAYDSAYLELAQRRNLNLATLDDRLAAAARKCGIPVLIAGRKR